MLGKALRTNFLSFQIQPEHKKLLKRDECPRKYLSWKRTSCYCSESHQALSWLPYNQEMPVLSPRSCLSPVACELHGCLQNCSSMGGLSPSAACTTHMAAAERGLWESHPSKGAQVFPGALGKGWTEPGRSKYCFFSHKENCPWCNRIFNTASTKISPVSVALNSIQA